MGQTNKTTANSYQPGGDHYIKRELQPWDAIAAWDLDFFQGNIVKYVVRWKDKNGFEDLEKAQHYLQKYIEIQRAKSEPTGEKVEVREEPEVVSVQVGGSAPLGEVAIEPKRMKELIGVLKRELRAIDGDECQGIVDTEDGVPVPRQVLEYSKEIVDELEERDLAKSLPPTSNERKYPYPDVCLDRVVHTTCKLADEERCESVRHAYGSDKLAEEKPKTGDDLDSVVPPFANEGLPF